MDAKPFFEFSVLDFKESNVNELKKFRKEELNIDNISNTASELKYTNELMNDRIKAALDQPSEFEQAQQVVAIENIAPKVEEEIKIVTTMEELESFFIIKSILRESIPVGKVAYKDTLRTSASCMITIHGNRFVDCISRRMLNIWPYPIKIKKRRKLK